MIARRIFALAASAMLLLSVAALPASSGELRLEISGEAMEKLSSMGGDLRLEWGLYRNT